MKRTIITFFCILFLLAACKKNTTTASVSPVVVTNGNETILAEVENVVEEETEESLFLRDGESVVTGKLLEGRMSLSSNPEYGNLEYFIRITRETILFTLYEKGESRDLSTMKTLSKSYSVKFTTSEETYLYTGELEEGEDGIKNVIAVSYASDEFCSSDLISVKIYNDYGAYILDEIDTAGLDELVYDYSGFMAAVSYSEELKMEKKYSDALSEIRAYKAENPETFDFYRGETYLEEYRDDLYNETISLYRNGEYEDAVDLILECGTDYKDLSILYLNCVRGIVGEFKCGDTITYGRDENGKLIEWLVAAVAQGKVLLVSKDILFDMPFNSYESSTSWETSTLRKYLNDTSENGFLGKTFSSVELDSIIESVIVNEESTTYGTYGGANTVDRVFLLSLKELTQFFSSAEERVARLYGRTHLWWLRTPGEDLSKITVVSQSGLVYKNGLDATDSHGVRPALWVSLYKIQL